MNMLPPELAVITGQHTQTHTQQLCKECMIGPAVLGNWL